MQIYNHRGTLVRFRQAIATRDSIRIGYIGGSITQEAAKHNWPEYVSAWLKDAYPEKRVYAKNIGIGGTGSDCAVFRYDWEMRGSECDVIFVEFAVNDAGLDAELRMRSREGLLRKILKSTDADVVFVYTFCEDFYQDMREGGVPKSIADFEALAAHYGVGSVWMSKLAFDMVCAGRLRWEEWLPDGLHPQSAGSRIYAQAVIDFLREELAQATTGNALCRTAAPFNPLNWEGARTIPFEQMQTQGNWIVKSLYDYDLRQVLYTTAVGAKLSFRCTCRSLQVGMLFGSVCGVVKYRIDGGEWKLNAREAAPWMGACNWLYTFSLLDMDEEAEHTVELMNEKAAGVAGTNLYLAYIGIV